MDPLTALGLVGNVITFVDFSWKLIAGAREIYESTTDTSENSHSLEILATNVAQLSDAIITDTTTPRNLQELSTECRILANDLLGVINRLKVKGKHKRWNSFIVALREVWNQGKINSLVERLQRLHSQVLAQIQFTMLNQQSSVFRELTRIDETNKRLDMERNQTIFELKRDILSGLERLEDRSSQKSLENASKQIRELKEVDPSMIEELSNRFQNISNSMIQLKEQGMTTVSDQKFLRSLYFQRLMARHDKIETAHSQTFEWIFVDSKSDDQAPRRFVEWLRAEHGSFWIQGKAGSGKSTLMKFLRNHNSTTRHLQFWAGTNRLVRASYYFWAAGNDLQKSQEGLLRALLFEILRSCPELIRPVRETSSEIEDWVTLADQDAWSLTLLKKMCFVIKKQVLPAKFCFFIDGLDEYKGDTLELLKLVQTFTEYPHIKICISSRPWAEFKHAFGQDTPWQIKLEDLTARDIRRYVHDHLNGNKQFRELKQDNISYENLADEVVQRAQGVFLWVFLVVRSLIEGSQYIDSIDQMRKRLEGFPKDLEDFFRHMLEDIPPFYRPQSSRTFNIATAALGPLPLVIYGFAEDVYNQPHFALTANISRFPEKELRHKIKQIPYQLDARCKGLLEVVKRSNTESLYHTYEVDFLHRTVRDFLKNSEEVHELLQQDVANHFNPSLTLCHAYLADLKLSWPAQVQEEGKDSDIMVEASDTADNTIDQIFNYAQQAQVGLADTSLLDPIIDVTEKVFVARNPLRLEKNVKEGALLGKAVGFGLYDYVDRKLSKRKTDFVQNSMGRPLLDFVLRPGMLNPKMLQLLLEHGLNPNQKYGNGTVTRAHIEGLE
ncbi:hypothetical protein F4781DRAFT_239284 [Annulohypoxylon bovei var. microspora]|nr:hypothetical protein F4781DRAFT_239284 [Annulohypoxylon bovei var. microspora]